MNATNTNITLFFLFSKTKKTRVINTNICKESRVYPNDENIGQTQSLDSDNNYKYNITCDT